MDLATENRIAAILMKEAAELRRQADEEGVLAYLRKPNVRARPNSRFLTATVLGVQQANRAVEVNEMWRVRQEELELGKGSVCSSREGSSTNKKHRDYEAKRNPVRHETAENSSRPSCSNKRDFQNFQEGLRDEELEDFLRSRTKRGRGDIGPRMDETGPYLPPCMEEDLSRSSDVSLPHKVYGPEKPALLKSNKSSEDELHQKTRKKSKRVHTSSSEEQRQHKSKDKPKHKKRKNHEKKSRYHY